jgi:triacylglycerol esterase/lipase EstA (alpha/beta hydrolase family)
MLARKLQIAIFLTLIGALLWFFYFYGRSLPIAVIGSLVIVFNFAPLLAMQFFAARQVNKAHPQAPMASKGELLRAWWAETWAVPTIFCWRQAFRPHQIPDNLADSLGARNRRGVVFVHGFISNRGMWTPWLAKLKQQQRAFVAVNLEPLFCSIDDYAATIDAAVQKVTQTTGLPPLLVCHSMGGLAARAWLQSADGNDARVHHVVTVGTPHHGTWVGLDRVPPNMKQMKIGSDWLKQLASKEPPGRYQRFTCFYSNCDNIVFPTLTATLPGADNCAVPGDPHVVMLFNQSVIDKSLAKL